MEYLKRADGGSQNQSAPLNKSDIMSRMQKSAKFLKIKDQLNIKRDHHQSQHNLDMEKKEESKRQESGSVVSSDF